MGIGWRLGLSKFFLRWATLSTVRGFLLCGAFFVCGTCFGVGLLALPLPGAGVTFFAAAKKVTKESSFVTARGHTQFG
ncbi:hypothetical protein, partial [Caballeronia cordobensis]|uniref:hypothetical protein n=1 Tax=Caballeronia cordobensis TaxID=1353886 RepID=UPI0011780570